MRNIKEELEDLHTKLALLGDDKGTYEMLTKILDYTNENEYLIVPGESYNEALNRQYMFNIERGKRDGFAESIDFLTKECSRLFFEHKDEAAKEIRKVIVELRQKFEEVKNEAEKKRMFWVNFHIETYDPFEDDEQK